MTKQSTVRQNSGLAPQDADSAQRRLRIICLNYEYPPMGGGAGNATLNTALELGRRGHSVHVLTSRLANQPDVEIDLNVVVYRVFSRRRSIHQAGLAGAVTYLVSALLKLRRLSKTNNYDVFHFYFGLPTGLLALYVHCILKKPYIVSLRGSDVPGYDNTRWYLRPLHLMLSPITRYIWRHAQHVTALSEQLKALAQSTAPSIEISIVRNGISIRNFPCYRNPDRIGAVNLICVCRLVRRKGLQYLIQAMQVLRESDIRLTIVGSGEEEKQMRSLVESLKLEDHVELVGYVPKERLPVYYNRADIFVLPSLSESFGQVLLEAMSSGLPIVASRVGGIPETIEHEIGGLLIEPASSEAIVGAVLTLANDHKLRRAMSAYNLQRASDEFRWSTVAQQYETLYLSAVARQA